MNIEIEKKWLVKPDPKFLTSLSKFASLQISQRYLFSNRYISIRLRSTGGVFEPCIKLPFGDNGMSCIELEFILPSWEWVRRYANKTLNHPRTIHKTRHIVTDEDSVFEIDVFKKQFDGLVLAELELKSKDDEHSTPSFLGVEVTGVRQFKNGYMAQNNPEEILLLAQDLELNGFIGSITP